MAAQPPLALSHDELEYLFPVHLAFDCNFIVTHVSASMVKLAPALTCGASLEEHFCLEQSEEDHEGPCILIARSGDVRVRGSTIFLRDRGVTLFLGSPPWAGPAAEGSNASVDAAHRAGSNPDEPSLTINAADFSPVEVCEEAAGIAAPAMLRNGLEFFCHVGPGEPPRVVGDSFGIRQVLVALLDNALKLTPKGRIVLRLTWEPAPNDRLRLTFAVADTGTALSEHERERIFERPALPKFGSSGAAAGVGLELYISRSIAQAMGGRLWAEAGPGTGSTFSLQLELPLAISQANSNASNVAPTQAGEAGPKLQAILVATAKRATLLAEIWKTWNVQVGIYSNAATAKTFLETGATVDLILIGSAMDREELLKSGLLRQIQLRAEVPVIVLGGPGGDVSFLQAILNPYAILEQPYPPSAVRKLVTQLARRQPNRPARPVPPEILVADDNSQNRNLVQRILTPAGFKVDFAENGPIAVAKAASRRYDLVLMDIQMPGMNGFETTRVIRQQEQSGGHSPVPIIALTAHRAEDLKADSVGAEMDDCVMKPLRREHLLSVVRKWVLSRPQILIVDDRVENRNLLLRMLRALPECRLRTATTVDEALEVVRNRRSSLVLLRAEMQRGEVLTAIPLIRQADPALRIVAITNSADRASRRNCLEAGCTDCLAEPLQPAAVLEIARRYLRRPEPQAAPLSPTQGAETVLIDADLAEIVPQYLQEVAQDLAVVQERHAAGDFATIQTIGHNLKGTGTSYGLPNITSIGALIEASARAGHAPEVQSAIRKLGDYLAALRWDIKR
jgi:CheY-like chemotaxis protein/HPt (histidine-containing phosphotransfer) domain-containing protein